MSLVQRVRSSTVFCVPTTPILAPLVSPATQSAGVHVSRVRRSVTLVVFLANVTPMGVSLDIPITAQLKHALIQTEPQSQPLQCLQDVQGVLVVHRLMNAGLAKMDTCSTLTDSVKNVLLIALVVRLMKNVQAVCPDMYWSWSHAWPVQKIALVALRRANVLGVWAALF